MELLDSTWDPLCSIETLCFDSAFSRGCWRVGPSRSILLYALCWDPFRCVNRHAIIFIHIDTIIIMAAAENSWHAKVFQGGKYIVLFGFHHMWAWSFLHRTTSAVWQSGNRMGSGHDCDWWMIRWIDDRANSGQFFHMKKLIFLNLFIMGQSQTKEQIISEAQCKIDNLIETHTWIEERCIEYF